MSIKILVVLALSIFKTTSVYADLNDAKSISSAWKSEKTCNGNGLVANNYSLHSDNENILNTNKIILKELGLEFDIPQMGDIVSTTIKLNLQDTSRGVIDSYIHLSEKLLDSPSASVVVTELPSSMTTRDQAFSAVEMLERQLAIKSGQTVKLENINGPHGKSLEMIVPNRVSSPCFPTSDFKLLTDSKATSTIGISRFSFIDGKLIEFSIIVEIPREISNAKHNSYARQVMDGYWVRLKII